MPGETKGAGYTTDWPRRLFVEQLEVHLPFLQAAEGRADAEVTTLVDLLRDLGVSDGARVLDFAYSTGRHAIRLTQLGFRLAGIDLAPFYIEHARQAGREKGVDVDWVEGAGLDVHWLVDGPFDADSKNIWIMATVDEDLTSSTTAKGQLG